MAQEEVIEHPDEQVFEAETNAKVKKARAAQKRSEAELLQAEAKSIEAKNRVARAKREAELQGKADRVAAAELDAREAIAKRKEREARSPAVTRRTFIKGLLYTAGGAAATGVGIDEGVRWLVKDKSASSETTIRENLNKPVEEQMEIVKGKRDSTADEKVPDFCEYFGGKHTGGDRVIALAKKFKETGEVPKGGFLGTGLAYGTQRYLDTYNGQHEDNQVPDVETFLKMALKYAELKEDPSLDKVQINREIWGVLDEGKIKNANSKLTSILKKGSKEGTHQPQRQSGGR